MSILIGMIGQCFSPADASPFRRIRRLDEVTLENHELRRLLQHAEDRLTREQAERQSMVATYTKLLANSDASKKKHDSAVEEYHKYQVAQLQARIKQLEEEAATTESEAESSVEGGEEQNKQQQNPKVKTQDAEDVVELDSDDDDE